MNLTAKLREVTGFDVLPNGTKVFIRDAFLFGDLRPRIGTIHGWNVDVEAREISGAPTLEYFVEFKEKGRVLVPAIHIEGFLYSVK